MYLRNVSINGKTRSFQKEHFLVVYVDRNHQKFTTVIVLWREGWGSWVCCTFCFMSSTVNSETFARIYYSRIVIKVIFATLKIREIGCDLPISVND